jgi:hypothetical protein
MEDQQRSITDADLRLLGVLGARDGRATPGELRKATGLAARTLTRALGRLDAEGLLAERSKGIVSLSASAWQLLDPTSRPGAEHDGQQRHQALVPTVLRPRARSREHCSTAPARDANLRDDLDPGEQLEVDEDDLSYIEEDEPPASKPKSAAPKPKTYRAKAPGAPPLPAQHREPAREPERTPEPKPQKAHPLDDVLTAIFG